MVSLWFCGGRAGPFASKPAPTLDSCMTQIQCGSGLAREEAISPNEINSLSQKQRHPQYMADFHPTPTGAQ
ncbi:hypothetical protein C2E19_04855 [Pseudomonas sp. DTU12.3]|nr:hypothetical protein C2E19_04855 [Pseudomonas sp. DTU12.3]